MKTYAIIAGLVILVIALAGAGKSFASPAEVTTSKTVKAVQYKQEGAFDYSVMARPSYFYDNTPLPTSTPNPQIPVSFIDSFTVSYSYSPAASGDRLAINAILEDPGVWQKTINLAPAKTGVSMASVAIDLSKFQDMADTIDKEIGISTGSYNLTIQAVVSDGSGQDFVQLLPIQVNKTFIKIGDNLTSSGQGIQGQFDYQVRLNDNDLFGAVTLTPPAAPSAQADLTLGPQDTIFTRFIDSMKVNFSYQLSADKAIQSAQEQVKIEAVLENPKTWSKSYTLVPETTENGDFTLNFPLDLNQYSTIFNTIQQETGVAANTENLNLVATVDTVAQTGAGSIKESYTQTITTNLRAGILTWSGDMQKSQPGAIQNKETVTEPASILGLPVSWMRIFSIVLACLALLILGIFGLPRSGQRERTQAEARARQLSQKYKEMIVEVKERPQARAGETVIPLSSLQDLIKVSQGLLKPVHHLGEPAQHTYWVNDDSTRYEYRLNLNGAHAEANQAEEMGGDRKEN